MYQMRRDIQTFDPARHTGEAGGNDLIVVTVCEGTDVVASVGATYKIKPSDVFGGTLSFVGDPDWVTETPEAGIRTRISLDGVSLSDPYLRQYDVTGTLLAQNDDARPSLNSDRVITAPADGTIHIAASALADHHIGSYMNTVEAIAAGSGPMLNPGGPRDGTLDELADFLVNGYWASQAAGPRRFDTTSSNHEITVNISALPFQARELAQAAFEAWEMVANINFVEVRGKAQITFADTDLGQSATARSFTIGATIDRADVMITSGWLNRNGTSIDSFSFSTYVHEIGHALGLGHQGAYDGNAVFGRDETFTNDSRQLSIMSYFSQDQNTTTNASRAALLSVMMSDIIAIQRLYGAPDANSATAGDTIWGGRWSNLPGYLGDLFRQIGSGTIDPGFFSGDDIAFTIYDQGGIDLVDLSASTKNDRVNLNAATFSDIGNLIGNFGIARGTMIENLYTGSGNDTVLGNASGNRIFTAAGNDRVQAGEGADIVAGGSGNDTLSGEGGDDRLWGGDGSDSLTGGDGNDVMGGINGNDFLYGGNGNDELWGANGDDWLFGDGDDDLIGSGQGNDVAFGGDGNDTVLGGGGVDAVSGGNGNDLVMGDGGVDLVEGGAGNDTLDGGGNDDTVSGDGGDDTVKGGEGNDTVSGGDGNDIVQGNTQADLLFGNAGNDTLDGGQGWDVLNGGAGNDVLTGGDQGDVFVFFGSSDGSYAFGTDRVTDFNLSESDRLALDDALWGNRVLSRQEVIDQFGSFGANGNLVLTFGADNMLVLDGVTSSVGLASAMDFV